jgi:sec-independent protein translocase protein TatA
MRIGTSELLLILVIALVLFGGGRVAGLGKALGTSLREFREEMHKDSSTVKDAVLTFLCLAVKDLLNLCYPSAPM